MKKLCVFCGSGSGRGENYLKLGDKIGEILVLNQTALVYGGASIGLMGAVADGVLKRGGKVIGVIPKALVDYEVAHKNLTELHVVETMHQRKKMMYDLSDAFLSLPGGMGTLDEMFEVLTWTQLKYHSKKSYLFNYDHFYDSLLAYPHHSKNEGFIKAEHIDLLGVMTDLSDLEKMLSKGL